jgi:hypothetical protein
MTDTSPPSYSREAPDSTSSLLDSGDDGSPQIVISPTVDALNFQKGYVGAEGERAAIEGELQIKGVDPAEWAQVYVYNAQAGERCNDTDPSHRTMSLRTVERAYGREIELGQSRTVIYCRWTPSDPPLPSSVLFSIPLMPDTLQSRVHTPQSSLDHILTASLESIDRGVAVSQSSSMSIPSAIPPTSISCPTRQKLTRPTIPPSSTSRSLALPSQPMTLSLSMSQFRLLPSKSTIEACDFVILEQSSFGLSQLIQILHRANRLQSPAQRSSQIHLPCHHPQRSPSRQLPQSPYSRPFFPTPVLSVVSILQGQFSCALSWASLHLAF